jgi:lysozyme family protein
VVVDSEGGPLDSNYPKIISFVFKQEGGYTNDPRDPGGATNWGITIIDARKYWKNDADPSDVKAMPKTVAEGIYKDKYWSVVHGAAFKSGLDACVMDSAVNSGTGRANLWAAKAIGSTAKDYPTLATQSQSQTDVEADKSIDRYCDTRLSFLQSLRTWGTFGKGWGRRVAELRALAHVLLRKASGKPAGEIKKDLTTKAAQSQKNASTATATASGGTAGSGVNLLHWSNDFTHYAIALTLAALVLYFGLRVYQHVLQKKAYDDAIANL